MDAQRSLFGDSATVHTGRSVIARARRHDPETSHQAAAEVTANGTVTRHADIIHAYLREHPGETNAQIAEGCGLTYIQVNKRMIDLERENRVIRGAAVKCPIHQRNMTQWFAK
jgi:hypothetical protein